MPKKRKAGKAETPKAGKPDSGPRIVSQRYELVSVSRLTPHPRNPRKGSAEAIDESIRANGFYGAVVAQKSSGYILAGRHRVERATAAGIATVPVIWADVDDETALRILAADNRTSDLAGYDEQKLAELLESVKSESGELAGTGFSQEALDEILDQAAKALLAQNPVVETDAPPIDRAEELREKWKTERGQLWQIGKHRLLCGDSTCEADVKRLMEGERAAMVLTDPPYGMRLDCDFSGILGSLGSLGRESRTRGKKYDNVVGDHEDYDPGFLMSRFEATAEQFWFGADYYAERIPGKNLGSWLCWDKRKESQSEAIGSEFELIWSKAPHKRRMLRHDWFGFLSSQNNRDARNRVHPTQKPVSLLVDIMRQWGKDADVVVDPYLGSGTTMVAAEQCGVRCYGLEIEPKYGAVILERMSKLGLTPKLA